MMMLVLTVWFSCRLIQGLLNHMWKFQMSDNSWHHEYGISGVDTKSDYGAHKPGGLSYHSMSTHESFIYVFGGSVEIL